MGFDIECIIDIHNYPGEYFCPVCRTLVYPNEALQAQCTHVFCKPCLSHVANNSRACPYDGYLVTEADSKPLLQSDKAYAETIGKVKVRCLYHRSGCTWEGSLSDCTSHCSGCSFGNSPVVCNRCGVQIVHRQVHDHAQSCPGVYQVQQAPDATKAVPGSTLNQNQPTSQAGAPTSQVQKPPSVPAPLLSGQDPNQKGNTNSQALAAVPVAATTTEQWYQQYYQQYAGYYQQAYQQYYPYQQLGVQQYQQHPQQVVSQVPAYVQPAQPQALPQHSAQPQALPQHPTQPQALPQHPTQPQALPQHPTQPQALPQHPTRPQALPQHPTQPQAVLQHPTQPQALPQHQVLPQHPAQPQALLHHPTQPQAPLQPSAQHLAVQPQAKNQAQVHQHGASLIHSQVQPLAPPNQNQPPVNPPQLHSAVQPHGQIPSQSHHAPPGPQSQHHNPAQPHTVQPPSQQVQALYPQPHLALNHPQPSYHHLQSQMLTSQPQPPVQMQPQPHLMPHLQPSQPNQPITIAVQPQLVQSSGQAVLGHQSYVQSQPLQQHPIPAPPAGGSFLSGQTQSQGLPQPPLMHPPSQVQVSNQQQGLFPPHGQVSSMPSAQQQQFQHQNPPLSYPSQRPMIHSSQPSVQQYVQQPFSSIQSQLVLHNQLAPSPSLQSQLQSQGPPHVMQQNSNAYPQLQQNVPAVPGVQPQQPLNHVGRPLMPNQGAPVQPQPLAQSFSGYGVGAQVLPAQFGQYEHSTNQSYANKTHGQLQTAPERQVLHSGMTSMSGVTPRQEENVSEKVVPFETGLPSQNATEMVASAPRVDSLEAKALKSEVGIMTFEQETTRDSAEKSRKSESLARDADSELHGGKDGSGQPIGALSFKEERAGYSLESSSDLKLTDIAKFREITGDTRTEDVESNKSQKTIFIKPGDEASQSTTWSINHQKSAGPPLLQSVPPFGLKSQAQVPGHATVPVMPQGSGLLPQPIVPFTPNEQFLQLPLPKQPHDAAYTGISNFGSASSFGKGPVAFSISLGPPLTTLPSGLGDAEGRIIGRPSQNSDGDYSKLPRVPFSHSSGIEPNALRLNEGHRFDRSLFDSQDERFKALPREHLIPFTKDPSWPQDQGSRSLDMAPHGLNYDVGLTVDSANGGMVKRDMEHLIPRSPDKDYLGRKAHSLGDGSRFNLPVGPPDNPFPENRFLPLPGFPHRGDYDGAEGLRFGENRVPGLHDQFRRADWFGQDVPPRHFRRGENSPNHFGPFPGHARMGELSGPANPPPNFHYGEPFASEKPVLHPGDPGFKSSFSLQGFPNHGPFAGDRGHFDNSRKRKYLSMGWCRICKVDCETVEGLDMHSQTREHQKMSMDMVMSIKQQNKKKTKTSSDRAGRELGGKKGNHGPEVHGKRP